MQNIQVPESWHSDIQPEKTDMIDGWISNFKDQQLSQLVNEALHHNNDLKVAAANAARAKAFIEASSAKLSPTITTSAFRKTNDTIDMQGAVFSAIWEIDVWGRIRYGKRAATAKSEAAEADLIHAKNSLAALVAKSWFLSLELSKQAEFANQKVVVNEKALKLSYQLVSVGKGKPSESLIAQTQLNNAKEELNQIQLALTLALQALESLVGRYPSGLIEIANDLPKLPKETPTSIPSTLLERRPDVIAAERKVAAAFDLVEEAKAARLPTISLTAGINSISTNNQFLRQDDRPSFNWGGSIFSYLIDGGLLASNVKVRSAEQEKALAEYAITGQRAFYEVEQSLAQQSMLEQRNKFLQAAVEDQEKILQITTKQYQVGLKSMSPLLSDEIALFNAKSKLLRVQSEQLMQRVNLHLALGGAYH